MSEHRRKRIRSFLVGIVGLALFFLGLQIWILSSSDVEEITLHQLAEYIDDERVSKIEVSGNTLTVVMVDGKIVQAYSEEPIREELRLVGIALDDMNQVEFVEIR